MHKLLGLLVLVGVSLVANTSNAASVYFRGAVNVVIGPDTLGLNSLPNKLFESLINTDGAGNVTGAYIVFQGKHWNFTNGTLTTGANTAFNGMSLVTPTNVPTGFTLGNLIIPTATNADTQAQLNLLVGVPGGSFTITDGVTTYFGGITAVPEPASMLALSGLVLGCGGYHWRRRRQKAAA